MAVFCYVAMRSRKEDMVMFRRTRITPPQGRNSRATRICTYVCTLNSDVRKKTVTFCARLGSEHDP